MKIAKKKIRSREWRLPQIRFRDEEMTLYAGIIICEPLFERLGLHRKLQKCFRHLPKKRQYPAARVLRLLLIHLLLGFRKLRDIDFYREDPMVRRVAGLKRLPSVLTLSRVLEQCDDRSVQEMEQSMAELVLQRVREEKLVKFPRFDGQHGRNRKDREYVTNKS